MQKSINDSYTKCLEEIDSSLTKYGNYTIFFNKPNEYKTSCTQEVTKDIIYEYVKKGATYIPFKQTIYFEGLAQTESIIGFKLDGSHVSNK
jgi:hypothetical protein